MNFELSEEETMLAGLADRFVADRYDIERRRAYLAEAQGFFPGKLGFAGRVRADGSAPGASRWRHGA